MRMCATLSTINTVHLQTYKITSNIRDEGIIVVYESLDHDVMLPARVVESKSSLQKIFYILL